ncbi:hypothetical protein ACFV0Z_04090 [Streptomyces xiamenensis]|uniref:hypothetical protein n=1 Tax=Streptomyces xiamenensis TaxID=408015 RepID=UPI0036799A94
MTATDRFAPVAAPDGVNPLRARAAVRDLYARPTITPGDLSAPLLVLPNDGPAASELPGAVAVGDIARTVRRWWSLGIHGVKLFAAGHDRDGQASGALLPGNRMLAGIEAVKAAEPGMAVTTEVCGCSWTDHGQCVLRRSDDGRIDLGATFELMGTMAVRHAEAGADVVSPTAMLDGSVRAVRVALNDGHRDVGVNPNVALHTVLYGPFKQLMGTNPVAGHRRGLQLEPGRADRDALVQARQWVTEGADSLTLQPVMTAMDVLVRLRADQQVPLVAYSTSGEWAALRQLGPAGVVEYHAALKRAGADVILSFAAEEVARRLEDGRG